MAEVTEKKFMRFRKALKYLLTGVVLGACVCGGFYILRGRPPAEAQEPEAPKVDVVLLQSQLSEIEELATMDYYYTNMAQFENSSEFYGVTIPFTTKSFILSYDGEIKAGVDLSGAKMDVGENLVTVYLPEAEILSHTIDESSLEIFDQKNSIFNSLTVEDFNDFQAGQKQVMEDKAVGNGLLKQAAEKANTCVEALLSAILPAEIQVQVEALPET